MKYSIFHTSHCGSTLLSALLSKSLLSYAEPNWSHKLCDVEDKLLYIEAHQPKGSIVKYASAYCSLMPKLKGKKIFIYNKLYHHLIKHASNQRGLEFQRSIMLQDLHTRSIKHTYPLGQTVAEKAYLWADKMFHAFDAEDTIFIDCEDLFKNKHYVLEKICAFLEITYVRTNIDYHVKIAKLLHKDEPVDLDKIFYIDRIKKIEPYHPFNKELLDWCYESYGSKGLVSSFIY